MKKIYVNPRGELCPPDQGWAAKMLEEADIQLPRRRREGHKGEFGRVVIVGGSVGYSGAPILAAKAAVRTGAGLVTLLTPQSVWSVAAGKLDCAMPWPLPEAEGALCLEALPQIAEKLEKADVALIGPGLGRGRETESLIRELLPLRGLPLVLDADGINALEGHIDRLDSRRGSLTVLTPHEGEFARLGGDLSQGDRVGEAKRFAEEHGCCLVLKGRHTVVAFPDGEVWINPTGNPGMAKGGSGDVLGGMLAAFLGQGIEPRRAIPLGVYLHGLAGDRCAQKLGEYAMTPMDLIETLPEVLKEAEE